MKAQDITEQLKCYYKKDSWAIFTELRSHTGFGNFVTYIDFYATGLWKENSSSWIAIEIKVDKQDFIHDVMQFEKKQHDALRNSTQFYYCCPKGLINSDEVPEKAGLMYAHEKKIEIVKIAPLRKLESLDNNFIKSLLKLSSEPKNSRIYSFKNQHLTIPELDKLIEKEAEKRYNDKLAHSACIHNEAMDKFREWRRIYRSNSPIAKLIENFIDNHRSLFRLCETEEDYFEVIEKEFNKLDMFEGMSDDILKISAKAEDLKRDIIKCRKVEHENN